jgi:hypothetical protein
VADVSYTGIYIIDRLFGYGFFFTGLPECIINAGQQEKENKNFQTKTSPPAPPHKGGESGVIKNLGVC